ncbi:peptidoglycan hydrolase [Streptococcus infantarius subsp. infantarius]|nr:peptidoglycan hydrolase [Streptococcus infantarius subsp. infantarius]MCO4688274.1 peptidoglycan hydrolase [Streptococcus infantarius subsp. infantarius]
MYLAKVRKRKKRRRVSGRRRRKNVPRSVLYGMTFLAFLAFLTLIFFAYHSQEAANPTSADTSQSSQDTTTISFIQTIGESARQIAAQNDLYASVMIAQAILESNSGQSKLSQAPNYNFFGIKIIRGSR